ncbi:patatin-like phospholipase domain protein [Syntrophotalea carbinolica DSM 2380]|uniref:Patatin-like phospholipase domain protein n=1 Tax=Syntrophotalea carbinolica (strain DSM 2380 / NBRC 103641 / GraBd1) TaxID=338963 RepID=Q3A8G3_SYNC1|nr:patatin-like phospholipase family protein [Syntrophotalea carbinolica]ABA87329.1 patatin-like phospholipase domain protein [Syntrophotalea carbinolica DSM 2380]
MFRRPKVALALGGGAARGLAHIGVLEAFEKHGLPVDMIAGSSMGAIIGAIYALDPSVAALKERFHAYLNSDEFKETRFNQLMDHDDADAGMFDRLLQLAWKGLFYTLVVTRRSYYGKSTSTQNFALMIDDLAFEDTRIPFCTTALDLISGQEVVFKSGSLRRAVSASCAIPGLLPPVQDEGRILVDGGWIDSVPVLPAYRLGADKVVAVDVASRLEPCGELDSALEIIGRADSIARWALSTERCRKADLVVRPQNNGSHWADFSQFEEAVAEGLTAVEAQLPAIRRLVARNTPQAWLRDAIRGKRSRPRG